MSTIMSIINLLISAMSIFSTGAQEKSISESTTFFHQFSRQKWQELNHETPMTIGEADISKLHGQIERVSLVEIEEIYLPLSRLLHLYIHAHKELLTTSNQFLGNTQTSVPFIIGITGSVSVGKSTTSRMIKLLLSKWPNRPKIEIVTSDGFLFTNAELEKRGIMNRKGFPESFDQQKLLYFLQELKSGKSKLEVPTYSHETYDILDDAYQLIDNPDVLILEGVNILQTPMGDDRAKSGLLISDFIDFSIYVEAKTEVIKSWYLDRFLYFVEKAKNNKKDFYHQFTLMPKQNAKKFAENIWTTINEVNLMDNILPSKARAHLILKKDRNHSISKILLKTR